MKPLSPRFAEHQRWMETDGRHAHALPDLDQSEHEVAVVLVIAGARRWSDARRAAIEIFASATADCAAREDAWVGLSRAERALLDAIERLGGAA